MGIEYGEKRSPFIDYGRPSLFLDFAKRKSLVDAISKNNLITFTRSSTGTYVGADGYIKTAAADEPRFDHDPETGESLGLLIEEQRTNLFTYSAFPQSTTTSFPIGWGPWNPATFLTSQTLSPDGVVYGVFHGAVNQNGGGLRKDITGLTPGGTYYVSYYVKGLTAEEVTYFTNNNAIGTTTGTANGAQDVAWFAATKVQFACINLNGTGASGASAITLTTEWQRFGGVITADSAGSARIIIGNNVGDVGTGNEDGGGTWMIWGAQTEIGSFPTSFIPTTSSAVTRQPDNTYITGTNFTGFYNQTEGTVFSKFNAFNVGLGDGGRLFRVVIGNNSGGNRIDYVVTQVGAYQPYLASGNVVYYGGASAVGFSKNTNHKIALTLKENDITGYVDGSLSTSDTSFIPFVADKFEIGNYLNGGHLNGHISQLLYYPTRLTNTQLQALTQ